MNNYTGYYRTLHNDISIPEQHIKYLSTINYSPNVIYDIGAAALHWTKEAKKVWPTAKYYAFEAVMEVEDFYKEYGIDYSLGVYSDIDGKEVTFYEDPVCLGGNSYYRENVAYSPAAEKIYSDASGKKRMTRTIDSMVKERGFQLPDFVKIDVQGAELDILNGMTDTLKNVKHLIVELQHVEYNLGAKQVNESIPFIRSLGFNLVENSQLYFCGNGPDADYHFTRL
jgi:FkbM family methyltransferase